MRVPSSHSSIPTEQHIPERELKRPGAFLARPAVWADLPTVSRLWADCRMTMWDALLMKYLESQDSESRALNLTWGSSECGGLCNCTGCTSKRPWLLSSKNGSSKNPGGTEMYKAENQDRPKSYHLRQPLLSFWWFSTEFSIFIYTADPSTTEVWTAWVHLYM